MVSQFNGRLVINWAGYTSMIDLTTMDYLKQVIGGGIFSGKRLLAWDAFVSQKSNATTEVLKELMVYAAYIPRGCTKFIQAPDICWNKPFKERVRHYYGTWMRNGDSQEFTAARNSKAPALEVIIEWVDLAWQELSKDLIIKSFEAGSLTIPTDGSGDNRINYFKPERSIGLKGLEFLRNFRSDKLAEHGLNDYKEAVISNYGKELNLENFNDEDELSFEN